MIICKSPRIALYVSKASMYLRIKKTHIFFYFKPAFWLQWKWNSEDKWLGPFSFWTDKW